MADLQLRSSAFDDGERIPEEHGYSAANTNPPLEVENVPSDAESLLLIVDDPDAEEPAGKVWDHWLIWNIPPDTGRIPEGWVPDEATEGQNDFGEVGWGGPSPPDREHTYRFLLYALDTTLDLSQAADKDDVYDAASSHVVEKAQLNGTYPA
ncbi:YbhB/YbcL family Raf kinase inhibitor-like protein [Haloarcula japonica]|uniref:Phosphatidylethanolamine-binding protein n=1 Tax=Haloarcula japonica (strain ATCC 49778 / DSM 6131 / JCM 7785 / NBRC 101032 / NCIMB 13157 / TR-1) TaxID=1227453 RepID=M0LEE6_HALJT|nr:YbhB/YbcL family Raf kinase inhibitor-like protein [Haloarcula japonica]EMA30355.1 phosphatidylethanolamine-binding protein [Haloarcula japonica DSM 6131]